MNIDTGNGVREQGQPGDRRCWRVIIIYRLCLALRHLAEVKQTRDLRSELYVMF